MKAFLATLKALLAALDQKVYQLERVLIIGALIVMCLVVALQVTLRLCNELTVYLTTLSETRPWVGGIASLLDTLPGGFPWAEELARYLMIWAGFLGASIATRKRRHLKIDILPRFLPPDGQAKTMVERATSLISAGFCFFLVVVGYEFVDNSFRFGRTSATLGFFTWKLPIWIVQLSIPLTMFVIACRFLGQAFGEIKPESEIDRLVER